MSKRLTVGVSLFATSVALSQAKVGIDNANYLLSGGDGYDFLSPSCMLNNFSCPMPRGWETDWSLLNSTAMLTTNFTGFDPVHHWGYVTIDWQAGASKWVHDDPMQANCEAVSAANCQTLKQSGKVRRCGIYHNMELSLEWLESERKVMDQEHVDAGWFIKVPEYRYLVICLFLQLDGGDRSKYGIDRLAGCTLHGMKCGCLLFVFAREQPHSFICLFEIIFPLRCLSFDLWLVSVCERNSV